MLTKTTKAKKHTDKYRQKWRNYFAEKCIGKRQRHEILAKMKIVVMRMRHNNFALVVSVIFFELLLAVSQIIVVRATILPTDYYNDTVAADEQNKCVLKAPLFLTPYILSNDTARARRLARVSSLHPPVGSVEGEQQQQQLVQYAGFLTVNASDSSNMFFWLIEKQSTTEDVKSAVPLIIWLQGGPGASSLFGLFNENGPYSVDIDKNNRTFLRRRATSWSKIGHVLFIDNPVGTGFSFTQSDDGYSRTETQIGWNLYNFLAQFYQLFPKQLNSPLFIAGESYAGKFIPAFAHRIHVENYSNKKLRKMNKIFPLAGLILGNVYIDPYNMIDRSAPLMYYFGMADRRQVDYVQKVIKKVKKLIRKNEFFRAFRQNDQLFDGWYRRNQPTYMQNITGMSSFYNIQFSRDPPNLGNYQALLAQCRVRNALHVGNVTFNVNSTKVESFLLPDVMKSTRHWLLPLFNNENNNSYRVLIYNGQLDIAVGVALTRNFLRNFKNWKWRDEYLAAPKIIWRLENGDEHGNKKIGGYVKSVQNGRFVQAIVRNAGHLVPHDQPEAALELVRMFLRNQSFVHS